MECYGQSMNYISIKVYGKVQGVFFRKYTQQMAQHLSLKGFVTNRIDGTVYIEATGEAGSVSEFIKWCHTGSPGSHVTKVEVSEISNSDIKSFSGFSIEY